MKHIYITCLLLLSTFALANASQDNRAKTILDHTADAYRKAGGIHILFGGTQQGTLLLKGECFYLECGGVKSWFDGKTQWSYVEQNEEVTVSNPSPEELQSINPYALINSYATLFDYRYGTRHTINGKQGDEIILTPRQKGDIRSIVLFISGKFQPLYITINLSNGQTQEFRILSYKTRQAYTDDTFRFNPKHYPDAEVIDMR